MEGGRGREERKRNDEVGEEDENGVSQWEEGDGKMIGAEGVRGSDTAENKEREVKRKSRGRVRYKENMTGRRSEGGRGRRIGDGEEMRTRRGQEEDMRADGKGGRGKWPRGRG